MARTANGRNNGGAKQLADTIEVILASGTGPTDISFDEIRISLKKSYGFGLDAAHAFIERHLSTALDILVERDWSSVKTTTYWDDLGHVVPGSEPEIRRCIAGIGRSSKAVGLHFTLVIDDWLFLYARDHGARVWRGKRKAEIDRLDDAAQHGNLSAAGLVIADRSAVDPYVGDKAYVKVRKAVLVIKP